MKITRYPMCSDQLAQIDCRIEECVFHSSGACHNISPAITLSFKGSRCWSYLSEEEDWNYVKENIGDVYVCRKIFESGMVPPLWTIGKSYKIIDAKSNYKQHKVAVAFKDDGGKKRWYSLRSIKNNFEKVES